MTKYVILFVNVLNAVNLNTLTRNQNFKLLEDYVRKWAKQEKLELDTLSD